MRTMEGQYKVSGVLKSVGKIFKKAVSLIKKIAIPALAIAAVVFTGGAALGLLPTFASAIGGVVGSLGLSTGLASALTAGVVNAGFGAAAGGLLGGRKGMEMGFLAGAGSGLLGMPAIGASGAAGAAGGAGSAATAAGASVVEAATAAGAIPGAVSAAAPSLVSTTVAGGGGLLGGVNPLIASNLIQGLGSGLSNSAAAKEERRERERRTANYSLEGSLLDPAVMAGVEQATQFSPYDAQPKWTYDAVAGRMVRAN